MDIQRTEAELVKFHSYLRDKGLMNPRTAYSRSQAAQAVLAVLDSSEKADLSSIDREVTFRRFVNKNGQRFTPDSLETYRHRFNAALDEFLSYVRDPAGYRPSSGQRERNVGVASNATASQRIKTASPTTQPLATEAGRQDLLAYPLPLVSGALAQLLLPAKITKADAQRITSLVSAMVTALAVEEEVA